MLKLKSLWLIIVFSTALAIVLAACGSTKTVQSTQPTAAASQNNAAAVSQQSTIANQNSTTATSPQPAAANQNDTAVASAQPAATESACPAATVADAKGVAVGQYPHQYELAEYNELADCSMSFSENPNIAKLNKELNGDSATLPSVANRLPSEPLVIPPYDEIGTYGGRLRGVSKSPESGTSHFLSTRHVNLFRFDEDLKTIVPNVAKSWEYNNDYTELTVHLRKGHKWSDGEPFTADDILFWYYDIERNTDLFENVSSVWVFGGEPMEIEKVDDTTVKFKFAVPAPNFVTFMATTYIQPFQPKHMLSQFHPKYNDKADEVAKSFGFDDWTGMFKLYFNDWKDTYHPYDGPEGTQHTVPTLESHVLVEETPDHRRYVANPYFYMVDTAGNQLPYYDEAYEIYSEDEDATTLKLINGEIDYKDQSVELPRFPELKRNEANGNYRVFLPPTSGEIMYYAFNITHQDPEKAKIFGDVRFRQAMSLALNRNEIKEIVYLGQGVPQQALPVDPVTVDWVPEKAKTQFTEYDPDAANKLLDDMGLTQRDSDGFRLQFDGKPFTIFLQYAPQGGPTQVHELAKKYWEAVGIRVQLKEVSSDLYRQETSQNKHDVATWRNGAGIVEVVGNTQIMTPPFGDYLDTRTGVQWNQWMESNGSEGIEPPADVKKLYGLADQFKSYPIGSPEQAKVGQEIVDIFANNLFFIGVVGEIPAPVYANNRVGNFGEFTIKSYSYYWSYPFRPIQWYIKK